MSLNRVSSLMIHNPNGDSNLHDFLKNKVSLSVSEFGFNPNKPYSKSTVAELLASITRGLKVLNDRAYGLLEIPPTLGFSDYVSFIEAKKEGSVVKLKFVSHNYRYPISGGRPFGGDYQVGDIVYNTDITRNNALGWVCTQNGSPGEWKAFDFIKDWSSQIENMSYLPDASIRQFGRLINLTTNNLIYACRKSGQDYVWVCIDSPVGSTENRPKVGLTTGMTYYNTDIESLEIWNGSRWAIGSGGGGSNGGGLVGNLDDLTTNNKNNVVDAINEVYRGIEGVGFKTTSFLNDGSISEVTKKKDGTIIKEKLTTFNNDGTISEKDKRYNSEGILMESYTKLTKFLSDGSIEEEVILDELE